MSPIERGRKIMKALGEKGLTPTAAARRADLTYRAFKLILDGKTTNLLSTTVEKLVGIGVPREVLVPEVSHTR